MLKQVVNFITLGVRDLEQMKNFYREKFQWKIMSENEQIIFFKLNGVILSLYPSHELAADIGITHDGNGFKQFTLAINFSSEQEVDEAFQKLERNGVTVVKRPVRAVWGGYSGYVADPEGNYWELAFNPFLTLDSSGNSVSHT